MDASSRPSARQIAERVQAYLDGDRDVAQRKQVALDQLGTARAALARGARAQAMHAAGRAMALDPGCPGAAEMVTALVLEPPQDPPAELREALRLADANSVRRHALSAIGAYLAIASFLPLAMWNGIRKWPEVLAVFGVALLLATAAWRIRRRPDRTFLEMFGYALANGVLLALISRMAGPFTFVPALICVVTMSVMAYPVFLERSWVLILTMLASFCTPLILEAGGFLPTTWELRDGGMFSHAEALVISGTPTMILVIGATLATVTIAGIHAAALGRSNRHAQQQLVMQAWHLSQLLPAARSA